MNSVYMCGKLLISFVGRNRGDQYVAVTKAAGARGGTIALGRTSADNKILQMLSLADIMEDVVFTLMREEADRVVAAVKTAAARNPKKLGGLALLLDLDGVLVRTTGACSAPAAQEQDARRNGMKSGYTLLTIIVNHGFADDVMAVARKAGATGGTILNARGTGTEEDVKFFGISLVPEKEVLLIVAPDDKLDAIRNAVHTVPHLSEPGGGIIFNMAVEDFIVLGKED